MIQRLRVGKRALAKSLIGDKDYTAIKQKVLMASATGGRGLAIDGSMHSVSLSTGTAGYGSLRSGSGGGSWQ